MIEFSVETITPELAKEYLKANVKNRNIRKLVVNRMARDMTAGTWPLTHQGIAFLDDGTLIDGQHRLSAIVKSGVATRMCVFRNLSIDAAEAIDRHIKRTEADLSMRLDDPLSNEEMAAVNAAITFGTRMDVDVMTVAEKHDFAHANIHAIRFAIEITGRKSAARNASTRAAIAAASLKIGKASLRDFVRVVETGITGGPADSAAARFREWYKTGPPKSGGRIMQRATFLRTQSAIRAFHERRPIVNLREPESAIYMFQENDKS